MFKKISERQVEDVPFTKTSEIIPHPTKLLGKASSKGFTLLNCPEKQPLNFGEDFKEWFE